MVLTLDVSDFFPSLLTNRVFRLFERSGYSKKVAYLLTRRARWQAACLKAPQPAQHFLILFSAA